MQVTTKNRYLLNFQIGDLCKELVDLGLEKDKRYKDKRAYSSYTPDPDNIHVTPWIGLANAIWQDLGYAKNPDGSDIICGRGQTSEGDIVAESTSGTRPNVKVVTRYNPKKGTIKSYAFDASLGKSQRVVIDPGYANKNKAQNFHTKSSHVLYAILDKVYKNDEAASFRADIQSAMASGDKEEAMFALLRLTDNAYRRIITLQPGDEAYLPLEDVGNGSQIPKLSRESILTAKVKRIQGTLTEAGQMKTSSGGVKIDYEKYNLHIEYPEGYPVVRKQTPGWRSTQVGKDILEEVMLSKDDPILGMVFNHLIEGPNGTGKSALVWNDVAYGLGSTCYRQLLSGEMSKDEGVSCFYPVADDDASPAVKAFLASMPDVLEAQLDPRAAYKKVTGKNNPKATADRVLSLVNEKLTEFIKTHKESSNGIRLVCVKGPTLEANECAEKYGFAVLLLDEITRAPQEIITMYNGFLEPGGGIQTPTGWVKRSPNLLIVGCANPPETNQYCKPMDESLRNRFQSFYEMELPAAAVMAETLMGYGYITDPILAESMADVIETCYATMESNSITGAISLRQLVEWGRSLSYGCPMERAIEVKVLRAITSNKEEQAIIKQAIDDNTNIKDWYN